MSWNFYRNGAVKTRTNLGVSISDQLGTSISNVSTIYTDNLTLQAGTENEAIIAATPALATTLMESDPYYHLTNSTAITALMSKTIPANSIGINGSINFRLTVLSYNTLGLTSLLFYVRTNGVNRWVWQPNTGGSAADSGKKTLYYMAGSFTNTGVINQQKYYMVSGAHFNTSPETDMIIGSSESWYWGNSTIAFDTDQTFDISAQYGQQSTLTGLEVIDATFYGPYAHN